MIAIKVAILGPAGGRIIEQKLGGLMACDGKTILKMARSAMREEDYLLLLAQLQTTFNVTFVGFLLKNTIISFVVFIPWSFTMKYSCLNFQNWP